MTYPSHLHRFISFSHAIRNTDKRCPGGNFFAAIAVIAGCCLTLDVTSGSAQDSIRPRPRRAAAPAEAEPTPITLTTRDGVNLRAIYLESKKAKQAVPVMLIHEWGGQASPYLDLAKTMQKAGHAVLIL